MIRCALFLACLTIILSQCRFAHNFTQEQILHNETARRRFTEEVIGWESRFIHHVGVENSSGFTYDGQRVDYDSGELLNETKHMFSASSKQSLHLGIIAKVFENHQYGNRIYPLEEAINLIAKKAETYEDFNKRYPGFGGWIPWVALNGTNKIEPTWDFKNRTPSLDNGQMFWAALAVVHAWQRNHPNLNTTVRERFWNITCALMLKNLRKMFFNETTGKIRAVASIQDITVPPENNTYTNSDDYYLDDPYEGELVANIITLLSTDFTDKEISNIWVDKRNKLKAVNYTIKSLNKNITVEQGFWYSSHEQWKRLFLPYSLSTTYRQVAHNGQKARVWNSVENGINGLYGATTGTANSNSDQLDYFADCGIPSIASQKVTHLQEITPYGAYPVILANHSIGLAWYHNMLLAPSAQTVYGSLQATNITGANISPMLTWDTKITNLLAILGGTAEIAADYLRQRNLLVKFTNRIETQYSLAFRNIVGSDVEYVGPRKTTTEGKADFTNCRRPTTGSLREE